VAYQRSKLANIYFTYELARRLNGSKRDGQCLHPGFGRQPIGSNNGGIRAPCSAWRRRSLRSPKRIGARTSVYLASSPDVDGVTGKYFDTRRAVKSSRRLTNRKWR